MGVWGVWRGVLKGGVEWSGVWGCVIDCVLKVLGRMDWSQLEGVLCLFMDVLLVSMAFVNTCYFGEICTCSVG